MSARADAAGNLHHRDAAGHQSIRDQRAMTEPRHGFRAHQDDTLTPGELDAAIEADVKRRSLHIVRIATKAGVSPSGVGRIGPRPPKPTQSGQVPIVDPSPVQRRRELVAIELRITPRSRDRADVKDPLDPVRSQQADERRNRAGGVPDREDDCAFLPWSSPHSSGFHNLEGRMVRILRRSQRDRPAAARLPARSSCTESQNRETIMRKDS